MAPEVIRKGNFVFISGIVATDSSGRIAAKEVKTQTQIVFDKLKAMLTSVGAGLEHVVKNSIFRMARSLL